MKKKDKDFLRSVMHERMTQHYADSFDPTGEKALEFAAVEQDLNQILDQLSGEENATIQAYLDCLFERSAEQEEMYYGCGLLDGYKLCLFVQQQMESA